MATKMAKTRRRSSSTVQLLKHMTTAQSPSKVPFSPARAGATGTPATNGPRSADPYRLIHQLAAARRISPPKSSCGLASKDGKLAIEVVRATLGPLPIPFNLGRLLEDPINMQLATAVQNKPFRVLVVTVEQGKILVRTTREQS